MQTSDDILEQAAERAGQVLPTALAELVYNEMQGARRGHDTERVLHESIAHEVLALPASSPADREALTAVVRGAHDWMFPGMDHTSLTKAVVDALISSGMVTRPAGSPDREALARIAHGPQVPLHPIEDIPSAWQAVEQALDRLISAGAIAGTTPAAPAQGREALIAVLASAICRRSDPHMDDGLTPTMTGAEAADYVDALIAAGVVVRPRDIETKQELVARPREAVTDA